MRIWEGLGNQMFQYAYIRALQLRNNVNVRLCVLPEYLTKSTPRAYELDQLKIRLRRDTRFEKVAEFIEKNVILKKILQDVTDKWHRIGYIEEKNVKYKDAYKYLKGTYYLKGWFQNEKYFKDYEEIIRKELRPKYRIRISRQLGSTLLNYDTVSVHIRRSDFKRYNNLVPVEYYQRAMKMMESKLNNVFYIVFSDEPEWVSDNMNFGKNVYFMANEKKLQDYEELFVMSRCKHNIIANSTFSWWGAWLNTNKDKIVIGPKRWFSNNNINIMPDDWIRL